MCQVFFFFFSSEPKLKARILRIIIFFKAWKKMKAYKCAIFFFIWCVLHTSSFPHNYFCDWLKIPKITLIKNVLLEASLAKFFLL